MVRADSTITTNTRTAIVMITEITSGVLRFWYIITMAIVYMMMFGALLTLALFIRYKITQHKK